MYKILFSILISIGVYNCKDLKDDFREGLRRWTNSDIELVSADKKQICITNDYIYPQSKLHYKLIFYSDLYRKP
ncbi:MAG: hypothetical protein N4A49_03740 [Marinifilaceae bacterium]|jgi:hypothetical protein|nr:hypothetical protein [Marinifilaceae bacterium]